MTLGASLVAQTINNLPAMQETQVWSLGGEDPTEKGMVTHSSILAWEDKRRQGGYSPWGHKESDMTEWLTADLQCCVSFYCTAKWLTYTCICILLFKKINIYLTTLDLSCSMWDLVPWSGIKSMPPALGAWSLSHWITREIPLFNVLFHYGLSQDIEYSSLCYWVGPCCPSVLYVIVCIY